MRTVQHKLAEAGFDTHRPPQFLDEGMSAHNTVTEFANQVDLAQYTEAELARCAQAIATAGVTTAVEINRSLAQGTLGKRPLLFKTGTTTLTEKIVTGVNTGGRISGVGHGQYIADDNSNYLNHAMTTLIPGEDFTSTDPLLDTQGSGWNVDAMNFWGATYANWQAGGTRHPLGMKMTNGSSIGTGRMAMTDVMFGYFTVGMQLGDYADSNVDESHFLNTKYKDCTTGVNTRNTQGIGHRWTNSKFYSCGTCFHIEGGGKYEIDGVFAIGDDTVILKIDNYYDATTAANQIGHQNDSYTMNNVMVDAGADDVIILDMLYAQSNDWDSDCNIFINGGHYGAETSATYQFRISAGSTCVVRDFVNVVEDGVRWRQNASATTADSNYRFENCVLNGQTTGEGIFDAANSTGLCNVEVIGCRDEDGTRIPDWKATLTGGSTVVDYSGTTHAIPQFVASAPASANATYSIGDIVYDSTPSAGGHIGWVCYQNDGDSASDWKTFGDITA